MAQPKWSLTKPIVRPCELPVEANCRPTVFAAAGVNPRCSPSAISNGKIVLPDRTLIIASVVSSDTFSVNEPVFVFGVRAMILSPMIQALDNLTHNFFPKKTS